MSILCSRVPPPRSLARPPAKLAVVAVVRQRVFAEALRRAAWVTPQLPKWSALPGGRWETSAPETAARCVATGYGCCPDDWRPRRALHCRGERRFRLRRHSRRWHHAHGSGRFHDGARAGGLCPCLPVVAAAETVPTPLWSTGCRFSAASRRRRYEHDGDVRGRPRGTAACWGSSPVANGGRSGTCTSSLARLLPGACPTSALNPSSTGSCP
jgi:hypothetical protein